MKIELKKSIVLKQTTVIEPKGQKLILSEQANSLIKAKVIGGKLHLYSEKIHFKSHKFNFQNQDLELPLNQVQTVSLYNALGFIPIGIRVR